MFGRLFSIKAGNPGVTGLELVKPDLGINNLIFEADIEKFPGVDINKMSLHIYNLPKDIRRTIVMERWNILSVDFGYADEGAVLSTIYNGNIVRLQYQRESPDTTKTTFYSYEAGDFVQYGFYNKTWEAGSNLADVIKDVCEYVSDDDTSGGQKIPYNLDSRINNLRLQQDSSYYSSKDAVLKSIAKEYKIEYNLSGGVATFKLLQNTQDKLNVVTFSRQIQDGKLVSTSGLIGIPTLTTEGLQFKCLVNPLIDIYRYVKFDNSMISVGQSGYVPENQFGAQFDSNGIYKVTGLKIHITNGSGDNYMEVTALASDVYNDVDYTQLEYDTSDDIPDNVVYWMDSSRNEGLVYTDDKKLVTYKEIEPPKEETEEDEAEALKTSILGLAVLGEMILGY